jgi:Spy/CpxP family protein refolding chaperone
MMRKVLISLAVTASALAVASPASAQYYPQPSQPQGYGWGQQGPNARYGQVHRLHNRVEQVRQRIGQLHRMNRLSNREAQRLDRHAIELHRRIDAAARRGLSNRERADIQRRTEALRHAVRYESRDGNRWGWNGYQGFDNSFGYYGVRHDDDNRRRDRRDDWDDRWDRDRD